MLPWKLGVVVQDQAFHEGVERIHVESEVNFVFCAAGTTNEEVSSDGICRSPEILVPSTKRSFAWVCIQ